MAPIELSASNRGITDHFFCFTCDEYVWDCEHLIEERLPAQRVLAKEGSSRQSFAYDGKSRVLETEFRVATPFIHGDLPIPPPPRVIQYFGVPRYVFTKLTRCRTARQQERFWADHIRTRFRCETVRTACRLPRVFRMKEAKNVQRFDLDSYRDKVGDEEWLTVGVAIAAMRLVLVRTLVGAFVGIVLR